MSHYEEIIHPNDEMDVISNPDAIAKPELEVFSPNGQKV